MYYGFEIVKYVFVVSVLSVLGNIKKKQLPLLVAYMCKLTNSDAAWPVPGRAVQSEGHVAMRGSAAFGLQFVAK